MRLRRTCVDVSLECYRILRDNGNVMHISDIFREFKNRFPTHKFTDPNQLRRLLWSHPQIRPVGKQSTYGLAEWSHVYYGSMRDLLIECISASDSPVPLDELLEYVRRHYPEATATNLYSTMTSDTMGRFKQYADGFGLSNVSYHGATEKVLRRSRLEFDERLADFMAFIEREGHYPQRDSENSQAETSLYSWRANILSGRLRIDPLQRREFDLTMESIDPTIMVGAAHPHRDDVPPPHRHCGCGTRRGPCRRQPRRHTAPLAAHRTPHHTPLRRQPRHLPRTPARPGINLRNPIVFLRFKLL